MAEEAKSQSETVEENEVKPEEKTAEQPKKKEKKAKTDAELEKLKKELEAKNDLLLRTAAEFDNFKKRTERERASVAEFAKANVIKQLLPIIDNIERAATVDKATPDYVKGIEMIVKQFEGLASVLGIEEVAREGDGFDPNCHEAVMHIEDENYGESVITQVLQKGYRLGDTVIRPAMVQVAN